MNFDEISFHDATILLVTEIGEQTIDFTLNFPTDWENHIFEKKVFRFTDVISYCINEIPFAGKPAIGNIKNLGQVTKDFSGPYNKWEVVRNKIEMQTNAGTRVIEYCNCAFVN